MEGDVSSREGAGRMSVTLHLAQALSNRGRRGRKTDFRDAERLVKRLVSQELVLSFVRPEPRDRFLRPLAPEHTTCTGAQIADCLRCDFLPECYMTSTEEEDKAIAR